MLPDNHTQWRDTHSAVCAGERGFTLIEIFVALSIFSLAALAMLNLQSYSIRTSAILNDRALAWQTAQNIAVERMTAPLAPPIGTETGVVENGGKQWRWQVQTVRTGDLRLLRLNITLHSAVRSDRGAAKISIVRVAELGKTADRQQTPPPPVDTP